MADFSVTSVGMKLLLAKLQGAGAVVRRAAFDAITVGCGRVRSEARKYCLRSPTQAQLNRLRKTTRKVKRKPSSHSRPKPGGLERSIDFAADYLKMEGEIFVAANSEGGSYAKKIHDERYKTWRNLGPGSIAKNKGGKVGEKFIERAIADNLRTYETFINAKIDKALASL